MFQCICFHGNTEDVAAFDHITNFNFRRIFPFLLTADRVKTCAAIDERTHRLLDQRQRALYTVINTLDQARSQLYRQGQTRAVDRCAGLHTSGLFVYLNGHLIALETDHLTHEMILTDFNELQHTDVTRTSGANDGSADPGYFSNFIAHAFSPINTLYTEERRLPCRRLRRVSSVLS